MQLLVSVRSALEVEPALAGGADIIDAKEPGRGSLGPVTAAALAEILGRVPPHHPFSVALGDFATTGEVTAALGAIELPSRPGPTFLKLGFSRVQSADLVCELLTAAVRSASALGSPPHIIAVAYADTERAGSLSPELICRLAHGAGAAGVLIDTYIKDGTGLLNWWSPAALASWVSKARTAGLLPGLAGALGPDDIACVAAAMPDVLGFRGAACDAGRSGRVSAQRVAMLRRQLDGHRETRDRTAYPASVPLLSRLNS